MEESTNVRSDQQNNHNAHPKTRANIISKMFFCWLMPTFLKGLKKDLTEDDLYGVLNEHESKALGDRLEKAWAVEQTKRHPSLWRALFKVFGKELGLLGLIYVVIEFCFRLSQPLFISKLMTYYVPQQTTVSRDEAFVFASCIVLAQLASVLSIHSLVLNLMQLGMKIRIAVCSLIYRKALKLSKTSLAETTIGQMVNLLSNDVNRFDLAVIHIHNIWVAPLEVTLIMYLLYINVGPTAMTGVGFLLLFIPLQMYMGKRTSIFRLRTAIRTDERVRLMNEIISGIQVIKMYTWEKPFAKLVEFARRNEIKQIRYTSRLRALTVSFTIFLNRTAIYLCILTYILLGNTPNSQYVFVVSSFYAILRQSVTMFFPQGITLFAEANVSVNRIQKFLKYEEIEEKPLTIIPSLNGNSDKIKPNGNDFIKNSVGVHLENASLKWLRTMTENSLTKINFDVNSNELVAIVGPVGSGKTTLLHAILKELPLLEGNIEVNGIVSYASQEPWLFGGSIRQNILFGHKYEQKKYEEVVRVCALERDFTLFPYGDRTLVGERGVTLSGGQKARVNLARAVYKDADIYLLDDPLSAVDTHVGKQLFDECISGYLKNKCTILVTHQLQYLHNVHSIYLMKDGEIVTSGTYDELQQLNTEFTEFLKSNADEAEEAQEEIKRKSSVKTIEETDSKGEPVQTKEERGIGKISGKIYGTYFRSGGRWITVFGVFLLFVSNQIFASLTDYFLAFWVNLEQKRADNPSNSTEPITFTDKYFTEENCLYIYSGLVILLITLCLFRSFAFFEFCIAASKHLHNNMFNKIVYGTMKFFTTNPSGRILNRFSKDMGSIDEVLPITLIDTVQIGLLVLAITLLVGSVNPWVLLPSFIIALIFYGMRTVFLASSRDMKRLEGTTRSPVFSHIAASLQGLTTIRAFDAQQILKQEFDNHQNLHSSAFYLFLAANRTFGFWLDMHCVVYTALVTLSFLFVENETYGGNVGLSITQALNLTGMFQWGMRQWSELENQMTSVERVIEYTEVTQETNQGTKTPPRNWPENGAVTFDSVFLRYSPEEPYVLKNLNFSIQSREKVGIVGRTGAGKSSLIYALFRLADTEGKILIDNIDTNDIPLHSLRSKVSIIPQEPVLFSGTLRKNLDPFDEYKDESLWKALEDVELKNAVHDLPSGLDSKMSEGGSNFSVGQRQLVCLARAVLRNNNILVLDEATANVDPQTDASIQRTIRRNFADCTVFTIAHRLHTIMDSDKVLVMDSGSAVEFGHPHELLQKPNGIFLGLVKQTGTGMAENLTAIANESYNGTSDTS